MFNLIAVKFTEVLQIDLYFLSVCYCDTAVQFDSAVFLYISDRSCHVRQLAHTGRLNDDTVRMILIYDFFQRFAEISHEGTTDAA